MIRRLALALAIAAAPAGLAAQDTTAVARPQAPPPAPRAAAPRVSMARFEIAAVGDSTITLRLSPGSGWMRRDRLGIVVDPRRQDALVARFRVLSVGGDSAVALLTGLTSPVEREHVAMVSAPRQRWYAMPLFWTGAAAGLLVGLLGGAAF